MTRLLLSNLCKNIVKKSIWKFIDIHVFPNQILNFLNVITEHGKIIADYTTSIERISQLLLLCGNIVVEQLSWSGPYNDFFSFPKSFIREFKYVSCILRLFPSVSDCEDVNKSFIALIQ